MTKPFSILLKSAFVLLFACSTFPLFAQHGGGGHAGGGGFHGGGGGGGFHGGGGGMRSNPGGGFSGARSFSPPAAGYGGARAAAPSQFRSGGRFAARPGTNYARPGSSFAGGSQQFGNSRGASPAVADGGWHSFGGPGGARGPSGTQAQGAASGSAGGFHVFSGNRQAGASGSVRSFSGQGNQVWENSTGARNVVPKSQSLSTLHNSSRGPAAGSSILRSKPTLSASSRLAGSSTTFAGNRGLSSSANPGSSVQQLRGSTGFGRSHVGFGRGCWNCGFGIGGWRGRGWGGGWGWGFGWGSPWFGFWGWDPFWVDPWWGWPAPGYGYYAARGYNLYGYSDPGYSPSYSYPSPSAQQGGHDDQYDQGNADSNGNWITPNGPSASSAPDSAAFAVPVLIYMKNGSVHSVRDYWMVDGEMHYVLMDGVQRSIDLEQVDLPRTNTENTKSGVKFIFKSEPSVTAPAEPDTQPASPTEPSPTQQLNAVPQPEAHT